MNTSAIEKNQFSPVMSVEQIDLLQRTICKGATEDELKMFLWQCQRAGLDPWSRQIYAVKRWDSKEKREVMAIQIAIDGFRLIAERTGKYAGQLGPYWCSSDGEWREAWLDVAPPAAAKVAVLRHDFKEPLWGVARFQTYVQKTKTGEVTNFWRNMPEVMIAKAAEAVALRRAFPLETSGLYTREEMAEDVESVEVIEPKETAARLDEIWRTWKTPEDAIAWAQVQLPEMSIEALRSEFEKLTSTNGKKAVAWVERVKQLVHPF